MLRSYIRVVLAIGISAFLAVQAGAAGVPELFSAAARDDAAGIRIQLTAGVNPNATDDQGRTALYWALFNSSPRAAAVLIGAKGIELDKLTPKGENALMMAAFRGYIDLVQQLIDRGAEVNKTGWTPLHYAATNGHARIVQLLLDHYAYIDAESPQGATPLMMAARHGHPDVVRLLLDQGADARLKDHGGATAIDYAMLVGRRDIAEIIAAQLRKTDAHRGWSAQ